MRIRLVLGLVLLTVSSSWADETTRQTVKKFNDRVSLDMRVEQALATLAEVHVALEQRLAANGIVYHDLRGVLSPQTVAGLIEASRLNEREQMVLMGDYLSLRVEALSHRLNEMTIESDTKKAKALESFKGLNLGLAFAWLVYSEDVIKRASVIGGRVRVLERARQDIKYMLEAHYFPGVSAGKTVGIGPYFGIAADEDDVIDALSTGLMVGVRRDDTSTASLNVALGVFVDANAEVLGSGVREGQPLPAGDEGIRFEEKSLSGVTLVFSFAW